MLADLTHLMDLFFNQCNLDAAQLEAAVPTMPPAVRAEWKVFKASPFYPNRFTDFLSLRRIALMQGA